MVWLSRVFAPFVFGLLGVGLGSAAAFAQGVVMVSPQMVEFEGRDRAATVLLINRGTESALYRLQFVNRRMNENGQLEEVEDETDHLKFASPYLRYAPRQIMLPPGEPQAVRILARVPGDLPDGEYRSHLLIQQVPENLEEVETPDAPEEMSFDLRPVFGSTIPVFIRRGELEASADLSVEQVDRDEDGNPRVRLKIMREGTRHLRGDLRVTDGTGNVLRLVNNVAVYTTIPHRYIAFSLEIPEGVHPKKMVIDILDQDGGGVMASTTATLPPS